MRSANRTANDAGNACESSERMSSAEKENIARTIKSVDGLLQDIESGRLYVEDLGSDMIERLKKLLK